MLHHFYIEDAIGTKLISEINSPSIGKVKFEYEQNPNGINIGNTTMLNKVSLIDINGNILRSDNLSYDYIKSIDKYEGTNERSLSVYRPFLASLIESSGNENNKKYSFEYIDKENLPNRLTFAQDMWGYFNGKKNKSLIPETYNSSPQADRDVDENYGKKGLLSKIIYPTGGYNIIDYEQNVGILQTGGLRIHSQTVYENEGKTPLKTEYIYNQSFIPFSSPFSCGEIDRVIGDATTGYCPEFGPCYTPYLPNFYFKASYEILQSNSVINLYGRYSFPIFYTNVTEKIGENYNMGGIDHTYSYTPPVFPTLLTGHQLYIVPPVNSANDGLETNILYFSMNADGSKKKVKEIINHYTIDSRINNKFNNYSVKRMQASKRILVQ